MATFEFSLCVALLLGSLLVGGLSALMFLLLGWWDDRKKPPLR